jgi:hypothetical protein
MLRWPSDDPWEDVRSETQGVGTGRVGPEADLMKRILSILGVPEWAICLHEARTLSHR